MTTTIAYALVQRWAYNETGWPRPDLEQTPKPLDAAERLRLFEWVRSRLPSWPYGAAESQNAVDEISLDVFSTGRRDVDYFRAAMLCEAALRHHRLTDPTTEPPRPEPDSAPTPDAPDR